MEGSQKETELDAILKHEMYGSFVLLFLFGAL